MSKTTKKKYVSKEVLEDYVEPEGEQRIAQVLNGRGNNLHEVQLTTGEKFLVSMPTKFRRNVWIKRGDYVVIEPIAEGNRVKGEIVHILYGKQIKYLKQEGLWPREFDGGKKEDAERAGDDRQAKSGESDDDADLFVNTNRRMMECEDEEEEEDDEEEEEEEGDKEYV
ncbi:probable RNA-binding protein EIF1AD [Corticium candelabrum]|uniref:probable RNA-binding protein EIF1AD n=1 Tax=Corticium candelabrum TaxID=121492 RepID=UPI002E257CE3|nr:probable RNA-binding protein EIF1AD [Corticium candelabrum]